MSCLIPKSVLFIWQGIKYVFSTIATYQNIMNQSTTNVRTSFTGGRREWRYCNHRWKVEKPKTTYTLIGHFLTDKNINFNVMQNVLASLLCPKEGMEIHDIGGYQYSFVFYHPLDLQKILDGGPWTFEQNLLVYTIFPKSWYLRIYSGVLETMWALLCKQIQGT